MCIFERKANGVLYFLCAPSKALTKPVWRLQIKAPPYANLAIYARLQAKVNPYCCTAEPMEAQVCIPSVQRWPKVLHPRPGEGSAESAPSVKHQIEGAIDLWPPEFYALACLAGHQVSIHEPLVGWNTSDLERNTSLRNRQGRESFPGLTI